MATKTKITITVDKEIFEAFRFAMPDYVSVSGVIETFIKEFLVGHYRYNWTVAEMVEVLRGRVGVGDIRKAGELGLRGAPDTLDDDRAASVELGRAIRDETGGAGGDDG